MKRTYLLLPLLLAGCAVGYTTPKGARITFALTPTTEQLEAIGAIGGFTK